MASRNTSRYTYNGTEWICPNCGNVNVESAQFCTSCGAHRLSAYEANAPVYGMGQAYSGQNAYGVQVAETPRKKSGALKMIAVTLVTVLLLAGVGFSVWHFFLSDMLGKDDSQTAVTNEKTTEQSNETNKNAAVNSNADNNADKKEKTTDANYNPNAADPNDKVVDEGEIQSKFQKGITYTVVTKDGVRVRRDPAKHDGNELRYYELNYYLQSQAMTADGIDGIACLKKGAQVTCLGMNGDWMKIDDDAWVCTNYNGEELIK